MRVAIVQPPRLYWAFINDYDNFMVPQAPPALAAVARAAGHDVIILDCLPMKMGWASLEARLRELRPDVVAAGENHAVYSHEVVKLMGLVKSIDPRIHTVVGGTHFAFLDAWRWPLRSGIFLPLLLLLATLAFAAFGRPVPLAEATALFKLVIGITVNVAAFGYLAKASRSPLAVPFPVHNFFLLGVRNLLWIFRLVGIWWIWQGLRFFLAA